MNYKSLADALYYMLLSVSIILMLQILYNNMVIYRKKLKDNMSAMLVSGLVMTVFDFIWTCVEGKPKIAPVQYTAAVIYALSLVAFLIFFCRFCFERLNIKISQKIEFLMYLLPPGILTILFISTPWTHVFYSIDTDNYTMYMPCFYGLYYPVLFFYPVCSAGISVYMWVTGYRKNNDVYKTARSIVVFVIMAVGLYFIEEIGFGAIGEEYISMTVALSTPLVFLTTDLNVNSLVRQEAQNAIISADLATASKIQLDALPVAYPAFPDHPEVNLTAYMKTAKEVGGDFYDYFTIDETHVCFVIADVSGKGIPAALCMMKAKTMIKDYAGICHNTSEIFTMANRKFCEQNKTGMFVTAWIGILDTETMMLQYTNAAHNYPIFAQGTKEYDIIKDKHGLFLGGMDDTVYRHNRMQLHPGDRLFLYTDGLTEAHDINNEMYGTDRLIASLKKLGKDLKPDDMQSIVSDIDDFAGDAPQFDDMTMVMIEIM